MEIRIGGQERRTRMDGRKGKKNENFWEEITSYFPLDIYLVRDTTRTSSSCSFIVAVYSWWQERFHRTVI
jgi:hypothetical protein